MHFLMINIYRRGKKGLGVINVDLLEEGGGRGMVFGTETYRLSLPRSGSSRRWRRLQNNTASLAQRSHST